ncbi:hypothetical protein [Adhaeribacter pallidiroseus]|uniref:Uncharacterized protein n=1 Tax=Adhaeribacter pallidiroseus TaxID=2072847 RepID=A0A369QP06_9BACT|nr:hypothetical protein [Adhaeribacter pallidiroseus]RDC64579.1 hypothetical protein AHMF7616_03195 [Adhaeribacter pallidiroseus]
MATFIYVEVNQKFSSAYQKPMLEQVKKQFSGLDYLDLDGFSEEFLTKQACQLAELADICGVYYKSFAPEASLGATLPLAEILIRRSQPTLVILQGTHIRLEKLFSNRSNLIFLKNPEELTLQEHLSHLYSNTLS